MGAGRRVLQHRQLRAAAPPRLGCAAGGAGRLARRPHELGARLASPRGSAFVAVSERMLERTVPHSAGWYAGLGLPPSDRAIVCADLPGADERLAAAGIVAAVRGGRLRTSWHLYNTAEDVDRVLDVIAG